MKCLPHSLEAVGICVYCGRALCPECLSATGSAQLTCSSECATALAREENMMRILLRQSAQNSRASAFYCYLCGGLSLAAAVVAWFMLPSPFLILFTAGCGLVLTICGAWYGRASRQHQGSDLSMERTTVVARNSGAL